MKWKYTVCRETSEVLDSGSSYDMIVTTYDENKAFELLKKGRNHLERIGKTEGKIIEQYYDIWNNKWIDGFTYQVRLIKDIDMLEFETIKELFKKAIDNSDTMNEAIGKLLQYIYEQGKADNETETS